MRPRIVAPICAILVLAVGIGVALAGSGGNQTGQACQKGKYADYIDPATNKPFATVGACTSFVAHGNTLLSPTPTPGPTPEPTAVPSPEPTPGPITEPTPTPTP